MLGQFAKSEVTEMRKEIVSQEKHKFNFSQGGRK